ncbi:MAG: TIGR02186 family protein [Deltaproteobacteria bacterium]|nr:TIGR02186 family protein [Deltaproteobacteria bacterium]
MKRILTFLVAFFLASSGLGLAQTAAAADQQKVVTSASKHLIEIGLSYHGEQIHFFGVSPVRDCDLIVRLTAEKSEEVKLSMKGRVGPFWMAVKQYEVTDAPFMYKIHSTKPIEQIVSPETAQELELGYAAVQKKMKLHLVRGDAAPEDADLVFKGLVKIKEEANLYNIVSDPARLEIAEGRLYKHYFRFPPAATEGSYIVESFAFKDKQLVGYGKDVILIKKVGLEHWLTDISQNYPLLFGIMAVIIALGVGLLVGMIFKKGGHH